MSMAFKTRSGMHEEISSAYLHTHVCGTPRSVSRVRPSVPACAPPGGAAPADARRAGPGVARVLWR
eukprot:276176-Prymnesium_polylepis.3